jgi:hypothetical protein
MQVPIADYAALALYAYITYIAASSHDGAWHACICARWHTAR